MALMFAGLLPLSVLLMYLTYEPPAPPRINVRWRSDVSDVQRDALAARYQLEEFEFREGTTWTYSALDSSRQNLAALIFERAVWDTQGIDRETFELVEPVPHAVSTVLVRSLLLTLAAAASGTTLWASRLAMRRIANGTIRFIGRRIHPITARELGFFRVVFAALLWTVFSRLRLPLEPFPRTLHINRSPLADWEWVHWLATQPSVVAQLEHIILGSIVVFGFGLLTRAVYPLLVLQLTVWTLIRIQHADSHVWAVAVVTAWGLLAVRWGDAVSLDETMRRLRGRSTSRQPRGRGYGFALWLPGLVFGTAVAAAGIAKLRASGIEWVLGGAVKYHFVTDAANAPNDWGLWIASHHWAAVIFSLLAVGTELSLGVAPLVRTNRGRLPLAIASLALLSGFYVFQGIFWSAWWMVWALFFLPLASLLRLLRRLIPAHVVIIDGDCPRCRRTGRLLRALDWFDRVRLVTVDDALGEAELVKDVERDELLSSMHVVCRDGTRVKGYGAYLHVAASLPPLWPLLPVAALPGIRALGEAVYARLAATRPRRAAAPCAVPLGRSACVGLTPTQLAVVGLVCTLQASASVARLELDPLMSDYPMYSDTYASTVDFDRVVRNPSFIGEWNDRREDLTAVLGRLGLDEVVRDALLEANQEGGTNNTAERLEARISDLVVVPYR